MSPLVAAFSVAAARVVHPSFWNGVIVLVLGAATNLAVHGQLFLMMGRCACAWKHCVAVRFWPDHRSGDAPIAGSGLAPKRPFSVDAW